MIASAVFALVLINGWTLFCFWDDKRRARAGARRIAEADLLFLALIGGSGGALLGRKLFRHKTRKQPFATILLLIFMVQIGVAAGLIFAFSVPAAPGFA